MKIIFEFVGGPLDGQTVVGNAGQQNEADRYYVLTHHGRVGQRFRVASNYAIETLAQEELKEEKPHHFQPHRYEVTDRIEEDDEVLIRVEHLEQEPDDLAGASVREHAVASLEKGESIEQSIHRFLAMTVRSMSESCSHCWPDGVDGQLAMAQRNLLLHLAHILLGENFSVFALAGQPADSGHGVDLVGIAASQDWFVASGLVNLSDADGFGKLPESIDRLKAFWLNPRFTIEACRDHMARMADHCRCGYGVLVGMHWVQGPQASSEILDYWKTQVGEGEIAQCVSQSLGELQAEWPQPILIRTFEGGGTYYALTAFFRIPR